VRLIRLKMCSAPVVIFGIRNDALNNTLLVDPIRDGSHPSRWLV